MGLNQVIFCLSPEVQDLALVKETEAGDMDLTVHEEVPSALDEVLEEIFKEIEVKHQHSHCASSDSDDNSDTANTNHNWTLNSNKEAFQYVSPQRHSRLWLRCRQGIQEPMNIFHQIKLLLHNFK